MYNIPYFKEKDHQVVLDFMKAHPFAMLIGVHDNLPVATQIPVLFEEREGALYLLGHMMRNTDHHKAFTQNPHALFVFTGAHTYVSASWYTDPKVASTWNYMSVHAKGTLTFLGEIELLEVLKRTTAHFENNEHSPASFDQLPKEYVQKLVNAIVAFEVKVTAIDNVFKLSQNRDQESYRNITKQLKAQDTEAQGIAAEMERREGELFRK